MRSIISELFNGDLSPINNKYDYKFKDDLEVRENKLHKTLSDEQKELHKTCKMTYHNYENEIAYRNFRCGFRLACKLIFEGLK